MYRFLTDDLPVYVLCLEGVLLLLVVVLALRRWARGSSRAKMSPLRTFDTPFGLAWAGHRLWSLTATVGVVAGAASVAFNDVVEISVDWCAGWWGGVGWAGCHPPVMDSDVITHRPNPPPPSS